MINGKKMEERLCEMLWERKINRDLNYAPDGSWCIFYYPDPESEDYKCIFPTSLICEQDWMELPVLEVEEVAMTFEVWMRELEKLFVGNLGLSHNDFESYDWKAEFEGEHTPEDSFEEWKLLTESGVRTL